MELEDFKKTWNTSLTKTTASYNLDELLTKNTQGPLQHLKKKYFTQAILLPVVAIFLSIVNTITPALKNRPVVWITVPVLLILTYFYYRSYALIKKMELPATTNIKSHLENQLGILQLQGKQDLLFLRGLLIFFITCLELLMFKNIVPEYNAWEQTNLWIRIVAYGILLIIQPYVSNYFYQLNFGQHISKLKDLVSQTA